MLIAIIFVNGFDAYGPRKESDRSTNISYRGLLPSLIFSLLLVLVLLFLLVLIKVVEAMLVVAAASPAGDIVIIRLLRQSTNLIAVQYD